MTIKFYVVYDNSGNSFVSDCFENAISIFYGYISYYVPCLQKIEISPFDNSFMTKENIIETLENNGSFSMKIGTYFQCIRKEEIEV